MKLACNDSQNIYILSEMCLHHSDEIHLECYVETENPITILRNIEGFILCFVCLFGIFGNAATLVSIPLAAVRKQHGFDQNFRRTTIFILNLSLIELIILAFLMFPSIFILYKPQWPFGEFWCKIYSVLWQNCYTFESLIIATVSTGRCIDLMKPGLWRNCTNNNVILSILLLIPWLLWLPSTLPAFLSMSEIGTGWNCAVGYCTQMIKCTAEECPEQSRQWDFITWYNCVITLSSATTTIISYVIIRRRVNQSSSELESLGNANEEVLHKREMKMTRTILLLVMSHCICNIPTVFIDTIDGFVKAGFYKWNVVHECMAEILYIIFDFQFLFNLFIYAASNEQFRMAYIDFWNLISCDKKYKTAK